MSLSQLVKNGTFDTDTIWNKSAGAVIANGKLTVTVTAGGYQRVLQLFDYVPGAMYRLTATVNGPASNQIRFRDYSNDSGGLKISNGTISLIGQDQKAELIWTANTFSDRIVVERQTTSGDYSFTVDNLIVSKLTPFNDIIKPADVPTTIFNNPIRTFSGEEPCLV